MEEKKNFDITPVMVPFFDVHLMIPLFDFLRETQIYDPKSITIQKIRAVEKTNLVESVEDEYETLKNDADVQAEFQARKPELTQRKNEIYQKINNEPDYIRAIQTFFQDAELIANLKANNTFTIDHLTHQYQITFEKLELYYTFAKFKYECGIYDEAEQMLGNYILVAQSMTNHGLTHYQAAVWGRLACRILQAKWNDAIADLTLVKESIEVRNIQPLDQLRQRGWMMHWSLFVYLFQHHNGIDSLIDLYSERYYLQTIENLCPWLLRYYIAALILSPAKRQKHLKDVLSEIKSLTYLYKDPMTEFLYSLFDSFDFDIATIKLVECSQLVKNDFFLKVHYEKFMHEARMLICEMYCTVHRTIDLTMLAEKLQLTNEEAEKWMVDMVRGTGSGPTLNAKIDSFGKQVIIAPPVSTAHQQVIEATKELTTRSGVLSNNLENLIKEQAFFLLHRAKETN